MNFLSQYVPMDIDVNVPILPVPMHAVPMHAVPMHAVPMHAVPKHVTFIQGSFCQSYNAQVAHYIYSDSMIIDEHPNKVIIR